MKGKVPLSSILNVYITWLLTFRRACSAFGVGVVLFGVR